MRTRTGTFNTKLKNRDIFFFFMIMVIKNNEGISTTKKGIKEHDHYNWLRERQLFSVNSNEEAI